ncbi:hypothetical protein QA600_05850 [Natronococcus sp. A-GB1]|uniref:hypothetical protein n=1 Tax=unclassified Natronococcus TaxID=2623058 RepID=UPI00241D702B|nr:MULTISPECIES: hypothetical protein [unclassified Natronococcus]MDG5758860.1 hypothetical protein [Natronococcus sp. A-GB1]MDG5818814.1 hypothetical protein [Natronococcus sp. A-GB7]
MTEIKRVSRKELTAAEILAVLERGGRVVIELSILGQSMDVVIRRNAGTYYCDTPMKLLTHDTSDELRDCLERYHLARRERPEGEPEPASTTA